MTPEFVAVSPTLGRPVTCYADVQEIRRRWFGDTPLPPPRPRPVVSTAQPGSEVACQVAATLARVAEQLERRTA